MIPGEYQVQPGTITLNKNRNTATLIVSLLEGFV